MERVRSIEPMQTADVRINGGFFVLRRRVLDHLEPGLDIMDVGARLAEKGEILAYRYDGFWAPMDTMKDKQDLDALAATGAIPWLGGPSGLGPTRARPTLRRTPMRCWPR